MRERSEAFLALTILSKDTSEVRVLRASEPRGEFRAIEPRRSGIEYYADHRGDEFFLRTNDKGPNFRLVRAPVDDPGARRWRQVVAHRPRVMLEEVELFKDLLMLVERDKGLLKLRITISRAGRRTTSASTRRCIRSSGVNAEFDTKHFASFMRASSRRAPGTTTTSGSARASSSSARRCSVRTIPRSTPPKRSPPLPRTAPVFPFPSCIEHPSERRAIPNPCSFTDMVRTEFRWMPGSGRRASRSSTAADLRHRAHPRRRRSRAHLYDAGKLLKKKNTFSDFVAVGESLVRRKYTATDRLVIQGGSAGGLLMGAVTNLRPDLFKAVVTQVPFVDVVTTMLDASLPLTVGEYLEWGNPNEQRYYKYMRSYSPYDNLKKRGYPAILVKTSLNDSQVMYWEPAKYVAKLRTLKTDARPLLFKINLDAGHGGASGRYDHLREIAFDYAFVLTQLGLAATHPALPAP